MSTYHLWGYNTVHSELPSCTEDKIWLILLKIDCYCFFRSLGSTRHKVARAKVEIALYKPLQKLLYFICILYLFYCYHTYFNPILILWRSILLLSLIHI